MNSRFYRLALGGLLPALMVAIAFVPFLAIRSELPDRVASHFDFSGTPDDSMTQSEFLLAVGLIIGIGVLTCVGFAVAGSRVPDRGLAAVIGFVGGFFAGLGAGILLWTATSQRGLVSWEQADGPGVALLWIIGLAAVGGATGAWLASRLVEPGLLDKSVASVPAMELAPGESAVFTSTIHSNLFLWIGAASLALGVALLVITEWPFAIAPFVSAVATLSLASLRVRADRSGLDIKYGVLPWPRTRVSVERIESASAIDVRPIQWGGWGYRGSLRLMKQAAVVHRGGPGLRLDLADGKVFVVTVDDPETPAALINAEVARQNC